MCASGVSVGGSRSVLASRSSYVVVNLRFGDCDLACLVEFFHYREELSLGVLAVAARERHVRVGSSALRADCIRAEKPVASGSDPDPHPDLFR